ncbi:hypothetical protein UFOVP1323_3 [uncultured Caudovirales phage]|uniref:Uncharacterized protein n=1 Tax=uncultured Caudovirales phage TaxID=2100421 RepID=A0A6J5RJK1_9CAUD|nr:hypothetical protein UFOVP1323_3 [uncultured Caudovirales phage]
MAITVPTVTGYSGFWERTGDAVAYSVLSRTAQGWRSRLEWQISQLFDKQQMREQKALLNGLIGAASGSNVTATYRRVQAPSGPSSAVPAVTGTGDLGGVIPIEVVTVINRNTTATDVSYLKNLVDGTMSPNGGPPSITFAADIGGNGGGGKLGF